MKPGLAVLEVSEPREAAQRALVADLLHNFGEATLKVTGTSMIPSLLPGDTLVIKSRPLSELRAGQVVLCLRPDTLAAHRLVRRDGLHLITRGDSLARPDPAVRQDQFLGVVVAAVRRGRAVDLRFTFGRRMAAWLFRRSDLAARVYLRFNRPQTAGE